MRGLRFVSLSASTLAVALGCGGGATNAPDVAATGTPIGASGDATPIPPAGGRYLQTPGGVFAADGTFLADFPGRALGGGVAYLHEIDGANCGFIYSDDGVVRAIVSRATGFEVREVLPGELVRPIGRVAAVRKPGAKALSIVDTGGKVLLEGVALAPAADGLSDPARTWPETWWTAWTDAPAPMCLADAKGRPDAARCGWIGTDGQWISGSEWTNPSPFIAGGARAAGKDGFRWIAPTGETLLRPEGLSWSGPPGSGVAMIGREGNDGVKLAVLRADGSEAPAPAGIPVEVDGRGCTDPTAECRYAFREGLAAVWTYQGGSWGTAYLGEDGAFAIPAEPCGSTVPSGPFHEGRAVRCVADGYVVIDRTGKRIAGPFPTWTADPSDTSPDTYPTGLFFSDGLAAVPVAGGWGYVDVDGAMILPGPFEVALPFQHGFAAVRKDGKSMFIDRVGSVRLAGR